MSLRSLKFVARDPFIREQHPAAASAFSVGYEGARMGPCDTRSVDSVTPAVAADRQTQRSHAAVPAAMASQSVTVVKATSAHVLQQQAIRRTSRQSRLVPPRNKITASARFAQAGRRVRGAAAAGVHFDPAPIQVETWDDLMNVGKQKKSAKKTVLWQQNLTEESKQASVQPKTARPSAASSSQGGGKSSRDAGDIVYRFLESSARARERTHKAALLKLEKIENNRTTKYRMLFNDLKFVRVNPYLIPERYFMHIRRLLAEPEVIPEVTVAWYEQLKVERSQSNLEESSEMSSLMQRLHRFIYDDICEEVENIMEKMCLLVMSIPADELSTPAWQRAIVFVMINILECELTYLKQWLGARHLHLLRFVEEETEKPATAPDSESALRPQPSVH